jgi:ribosomal protein S13
MAFTYARFPELEKLQQGLSGLASSLVFFCEKMAAEDVLASMFNDSGPGQQHHSSHSHSLTNFNPSKNTWPVLANLLKVYAKRISLGVPEEYLPLTDIKGVGASRARLLWQAGYRSIRAVAHANPHELAKRVLASNKFADTIASMIVRNANITLERAAEELRQQAAQLLQNSLDAAAAAASGVGGGGGAGVT